MRNLWQNRGTLALTLTLVGLTLAATSRSIRFVLGVFAWTCVELLATLLVTTTVGLVVFLVRTHRSVRLLDLAVSRSLELTAALPIVLVCAVTVAVFGWRMPFAVALVVGTLNGLTCLRLLTLGKYRVASLPVNSSLKTAPYVEFVHAVVASSSELVAQLVGLEAAVEYLSLFDTPWQGGVGKPLGTAVTSCNYYDIFIWSLIAIGLSIGTIWGLRRVLRRGSP
jgi:hypothetical protein